MKKLLLAPVAVIVILSASNAAFGCDCIFSPEKPTPEQARVALVKDFNAAFAVFTGEVVRLDTFKVRFKVDKIWKGGFGDEIDMSTGAKDNGDGTYSSSSCDYDFKLGEKYLVFAYGNSATDMQAHSCTRTRLLVDEEQLTKDLDGIWQHEKRNQKPEGEKQKTLDRSFDNR
jgi:hypothetical protein